MFEVLYKGIAAKAELAGSLWIIFMPDGSEVVAHLREVTIVWEKIYL